MDLRRVDEVEGEFPVEPGVGDIRFLGPGDQGSGKRRIVGLDVGNREGEAGPGDNLMPMNAVLFDDVTSTDEVMMDLAARGEIGL